MKLSPDIINSIVPAPADPEHMRRLMAALDATIREANGALDMLRKSDSPMALKAFASLNTGTGHFRAVRDGIAALYMKRNSQ